MYCSFLYYKWRCKTCHKCRQSFSRQNYFHERPQMRVSVFRYPFLFCWLTQEKYFLLFVGWGSFANETEAKPLFRIILFTCEKAYAIFHRSKATSKKHNEGSKSYFSCNRPLFESISSFFCCVLWPIVSCLPHNCNVFVVVSGGARQGFERLEFALSVVKCLFKWKN